VRYHGVLIIFATRVNMIHIHSHIFFKKNYIHSHIDINRYPSNIPRNINFNFA
jgi:hypothetical protein